MIIREELCVSDSFANILLKHGNGRIKGEKAENGNWVFTYSVSLDFEIALAKTAAEWDTAMPTYSW